MHAATLLLALAGSVATAQPLVEVNTNDELSGANFTGNRAETEQPPVRAAVPPRRTGPAESEADPDTDPAASTPTEHAPADRIHVALDLTYTTQYFFRGLVQETDGLILQPSIEIGFDLVTNDDWSLAASAGMWNSFHDEKTGASDPDDFVGAWYEADFYAGLSLTVDRVTAALVYTTYASPNDAFGHIDELSLSLALDDSGWFGPVAFSPYATIAVEIAGGQGDGGADRGTFLALGIEPAHTYESTPIGELTLSLPVEVGFSLDDYYENAGEDESFGYATLGLAASLALPSPEGFGEWSLNAGIDYLLLGDAAEAINGGEDSEWIFHAGFGIAF